MKIGEKINFWNDYHGKEIPIQEKDIVAKNKRIEEIDKRLKELEAIETDDLAGSPEARDLLIEKRELENGNRGYQMKKTKVFHKIY